jgi:Uma2 family endonuclease
MSTSARPRIPRGIIYPETDGKPMADNTLQLRWILLLVGNLMALFRDRADVFVGGNQNWYPVEGEPEIVNAPDAYVVFGRPKGDRASYKQWEEGGVPITVAFEVLSPGNTGAEMIDKYAFYEEYGVEEYYIYDPDRNRLEIFIRGEAAFVRHRRVHGFVSPRLGIRFDFSEKEMVVYRPDGRPFLSFEDLEKAREWAAWEADQARQNAEQARQDAEQARTDAEQARKDAGHARKLAARLAELSRKARHGQATPEELAELGRLEEQSSS